MKTEYILISSYIVLGSMNTYCFLFQRTARKIRQYAVGTTGIGLESKMMPDWYWGLLFLSHLGYIPLIWLFFIDWTIALPLVVVNWLLKMKLPVNDYSNIQKIKKYFRKKINNGTFDSNDKMYLEWVLVAEEKTK